MAGSFKLPTLLKRKPKADHGLPHFSWNEATIEKELDSGAFGIVCLGKYVHTEEKIVVKKLKCESGDAKKRFVKEAHMLNDCKGHRNICQFKAFCDNPYAIIMEYSVFSFNPFGTDKRVSTLQDFIHFVDDEYDFTSFSDILPVCAKDVTTGLDFLHKRNIAHRDLKLGNVLVSNMHYISRVGQDFEETYAQCPIICKLADFGLSRSLEFQTQSLLKSRTDSTYCGTPVYMAPELHLGTLKNASQVDLQQCDIWSLGLIMYALLNPNVTSPYSVEVESLGAPFSKDFLQDLMKKHCPPKHDNKYESMRVSQWWQLEECFKICSNFIPHQRPTASQVLDILNSHPENSLILIHLAVIQSTALECTDNQLAVRNELKSTAHTVQLPLNDGINCCTFLGLGIGDKIFQEIEDRRDIDWNRIVEISEHAINNLPIYIHKYRDSKLTYDVSEARDILKSRNLLTFSYELSEEFVTGKKVFSDGGRTELMESLSKKADTEKISVGLYTCSPYTFVLGVYARSFFLVDTHPIAKEIGGNGNGILVATKDHSPASCKFLTQWIIKRLKCSGMVGVEDQSLVWLTKLQACRPKTDSSVTIDVDELDDIIDVSPTESFRNGSGAKGYTLTNGSTDPDVVSKGASYGVKYSTKDHNGLPYEFIAENSVARATTSKGQHLERSTPTVPHVDEVTKLSKEQCNAPTYISLVDKSWSGSQSSSGQSSNNENSLENSSVPAAVYKPLGEPYKGDTAIPIFDRATEAYSCDNLVRVLINKYEQEYLCISTPVNVAHNVSFLIDTSKLINQTDIKCDDMGVWKHNGSPKTYVRIEKKGDSLERISTLKGKPQQEDPQVYTLIRRYSVNASAGDVRKVISILRDYKNNQLPTTFVQYIFKSNEHEISNIKPHGNSKGKTSYRRILPSTRDILKASLLNKNKTPKQHLDEAYCSVGDVTKARSLGQLPRGPVDIYNARCAAKKKESSTCQNVDKQDNNPLNANCIWTLLERARREEERSAESVFIRECKIHPELFVVLATDRQLQQLGHFCTNPNEFCVYGLDPTFNIFDKNISLTVTTYRNLKLEHTETQKSPVFIGPLLMHQRKEWKTYAKFAHTLITENSELEGILVCGTDGEKALIDGFKRNFRYALFLRCFLHFKDNLKRELNDRSIPHSQKKQFLDEIFGKQEENVKYFGLVDCLSEEEFETKLQYLKESWEERETLHGNGRKQDTFHQWFTKEKASIVKESMLRSIRTEAGLGNPPTEYTNNDTESANFMIKHGLHFDAQKPHEFIQAIKAIIETQFRNEDRAVFGKGIYKIKKEFRHLAVDDKNWCQMTHDQRMRKLTVYHKSNMDDKKDPLDNDKSTTNGLPISSVAGISVTAAQSGITTIPMPILEAMFTKASSLVSSPGSVVPKPGATDGSFIVAGTGNNIHCVTPGKGGSLKCDRSCINSTTKICEHILAAAHTIGNLNDFCAWYKRSKRGPQVVEMALAGGPKTAGKKPSKRKKTNTKKKPVDEMVDLLQERANEEEIATSEPTALTATANT